MKKSYLDQRFGLHGQIVVITGTGAIGVKIALGYARSGASTIVVTNRTAEKAASTAASLRDICSEEGLEVVFHGVAYDSADHESCSTLAERIKALGINAIHTLVNCAGGNMKEATLSPNPDDARLRFDHLSPLALEQVLRANIISSMVTNQQLIALLFASHNGSIIEIGSMAGLDGGLTRIPGYVASKAGLHAFARWLAVELARNEERYGSGSVRVNVLAPGFFVSPQNEKLLYDHLDPPKLSDRGQAIIHATPMGRFGDHEELVGAAIYLASPASKFVTGTILAVDGGFSAYHGV